MNVLKKLVSFKPTAQTVALRAIRQDIQENRICISKVYDYNFQKVMLPGGIEMVNYHVNRNDKEGLVQCLMNAERMYHLFDEK